MLFISDDLLLKYIEADRKHKLAEFLNKKKFTVSNTSLSYRQVNSLDADKLLNNDRKDKGTWRKFSFKEIIYTLIVAELKKFGLKHEQLQQLWSIFIKEPEKYENRKIGEFEINNGIGEIAIGCVFGHVEIILCADANGIISFYDPSHYALFYDDSKSQIHIQLNSIVNNLLKATGGNTFLITRSIKQAIFYWGTHNLVPKEEELLKIIRNDEYSAIRIKKINGEIALVYAEKIKKTEKDTTNQDLIKMLNEKDYQDISIVKRDGRIVNYTVEETIKL